VTNVDLINLMVALSASVKAKQRVLVTSILWETHTKTETQGRIEISLLWEAEDVAKTSKGMEDLTRTLSQTLVQNLKVTSANVSNSSRVSMKVVRILMTIGAKLKHRAEAEA
jgi:hypothetical protein